MALTRGTTPGLAENEVYWHGMHYAYQQDSVILSNRSACYLSLGKAQETLAAFAPETE